MSQQMESINPPTLLELESIRKELIQRIEEAQVLFAAEGNKPEVRTSKAALKSIEELIKRRKVA